MILSAFTLFHVALSLAGIVSGLVVVYGLLTSKRLDGWTAAFLTTTAATSVTGFLFPVHGFLPAHGVGIISLIVLTLAVLARYRFHLKGGWRKTYVVTSVIALYLNVFVLVVQSFEKVPALRTLAPTQSELPFQLTQLLVLVLFTGVAIRGAITFRSRPVGVS